MTNNILLFKICQGKMKVLGTLLSVILLIMSISCSKVIRERELFHPRKHSLMPDSLTRKNVEIAIEDTVVLRGWFLTSEDSRYSLIFFYGNGETVINASSTLYWLAASLKMDVLAVDYRGYGFSDGTPGLETISSDVVIVYDYLVNEIYKTKENRKPLFIFGRSLGSVFALKVALNRRADGVILQAPPSSIVDIIAAWRKIIPWYVRWLVRLKPDERLKKLHPQPINDIKNLSAPLLVIHGTEDRIVPIELGRQMYEKAGSAKKQFCEVKRVGHNNLPINRGTAKDCISTFIETYGNNH